MVDQRVLFRVTMLTYPNVYIYVITEIKCLDTLHALINDFSPVYAEIS